ncbi:uncharacterized protein A1O9_06527 [Exophiala aquamarina CBS 119918]|uniref:Nucleoside phosphorylase domain-containing protein n=1 Tax=Exophiala aquamarina CBS 119918 TaxID=1182545 RepID=A0A072PFE4_9EURO|nr:uncharacterized protein A1O9_06527 [Exophiala aquamarina CBS 119918]KEF58601.1 hypothetical protein A1O9_06527 [Exophiala aquamarina CBS 119918]
MPLSHTDYTVGCICPMGVELAPMKAMLDTFHPSLPTPRYQNTYTLGEIGGHNIVIAVLPEVGTDAAATVAVQLMNDCPSIRFGLLVGIGGGLPSGDEDGMDIRLGDVVVSKPVASLGGVVQYDLGKYSTSGGFERIGVLAKPPALRCASVESLAADHRMKGPQVPHLLSTMLQQYPAMKEEYSHPGIDADRLYRADYQHSGGPNRSRCDQSRIIEMTDRRNQGPKCHYGVIGSANLVVKDARLREERRQAFGLLCIEMEAAGLKDSFPCLVI